MLGALQIGDNATSDANDVSRCRTEVVVPRARRSPHDVVLQQVRVHEHTQLSAVTEGRHATVGFGNSRQRGRRHHSRNWLVWTLFVIAKSWSTRLEGNPRDIGGKRDGVVPTREHADIEYLPLVKVFV